MAEHFRPVDGQLDIGSCLPSDFFASAALASQIVDAIAHSFEIDRMSWRPNMKDAVIYLRLRDSRLLFADPVAGITVLRKRDGMGAVRLAFTREPATTVLVDAWTELPPIVRRRAWPDPIQDLRDADLNAGIRTLAGYAEILRNSADSDLLKSGGTSKPELRLRALLTAVFPNAGFRSTRPAWLLGEKGKPLELDLFSESMKLAVEVQGPFHDRPIFGEQTLANQRARDRLKQIICKERGISLLLADASALNLEIFTLKAELQRARITELLDRTREHGIYSWPEPL